MAGGALLQHKSHTHLHLVLILITKQNMMTLIRETSLFDGEIFARLKLLF